jgi:hypothetical protein
MDLTDIFHPATAQYTLFSRTHETFPKIRNVLGHKANLNKYKEIEITHCMLFDLNAIQCDLYNKRNSRIYSNTWRLNNILFHDQ